MKHSKILLSGLLLAAALLSACGDAGTKTPAQTQPQNDVGTETAPVTEAYNGPDLPEADFGGETFSFYNSCTCDWMAINRVTSEEETGDTLNDAVFRRNALIEERYNVKLAELQMTAGDNALKNVMNFITAGDSTHSIYLLREEPAFNVVLQSGAMDFADIPHLNLDREWWLQSSLDFMSIDNRIFYGISTFDTTHYDGTSALFFNKTLVESFDMESPYKMVEDGTWTIDRLREMAMAVASDLNGDGKWDEQDRYGYTSHEILVARYLAAALEAPLSLAKDDNDMLTFTMTDEDYITRLLKVSEFCKKDNGFYHPKATAENHGGYEFFISGNVLFYNETLGNAQKLRQMTLDFGILPPPKYDEQQENYYSDVIEAYFMLVPVTNADLDRTGILMEALAYESLDTVMVAAYDGMLQGIVSRDTESESSLDIIFGNLSYNHPVAFSYTCSQMYPKIFAGKTDLASTLEKFQSKIDKAIEAANQAYEENN